MGVFGVTLMVVGVLAVVTSVNGRLPLVLAAMFGQAAPIAPSYGSLQAAPGTSGWASDAGQFGSGDTGGSY